MANGLCTGPALFYFDFGSGPLFFGTTEDEPDLGFDPQWEPVFNQLGGSKIPLDRQFQGEEAFASGTFNRYNENVLALLMKRTGRGLGTSRGNEPAGTLGAFLGQDDLAFVCAILFPYATRPVFRTNGMPAGYRFFECYSEGEKYPIGGTKAQRVLLQIHAVRSFDIRQIGGYSLYNHDMSGLPLPN